MLNRQIDHTKEASAEVERLRGLLDARSHEAGLYARRMGEAQAQRSVALDRVTELEGALRGLIRMNEEHNAAVESVIGRPLNWSDTYLDDARAALVAGKETDDGR